MIADFEPSIALYMNRYNNSLAEHDPLCHLTIQRLQLAPPIMPDEMALISLEALEETSDSNVHFCLGRPFLPGRSQSERSNFGQCSR